MTESINIGFEMLQFISSQIISKQTVTGCGEYEQLYSYKMTDREGNVWLWQDGNGCRKVTYMNGEFTSVVFKKENNNLPSNNITYISEDEQGRIWIGSHDGIAQVVGNKAVLVEENHDAFKMMSFGKDVFFLSGTGTISLKREGEDSRIVTRLGEGSKVYSTMRLQNVWIVFTEDGSYVFTLSAGISWKDLTNLVLALTYHTLPV